MLPFMNRKILKARHLADLTGYHVKHICRLARQKKIDGNRANPGGKQIWWIDDERIRRWIDLRVKERQLLDGDSVDAPLLHQLTFVNNFHKWDYRVRNGLVQPAPVEYLRHDFKPVLMRMIELVGRDWFLERLGVS
jgi:hypothetical protein